MKPMPRISSACNDSFFDSDNEKSFYWAGYLAASSSVRFRSNTAVIRVSSIYETNIKSFVSDINFQGPIKKYVRVKNIKSRPSYDVTISNNKMYTSLLRFGFVKNKKQLSLPKWLAKHDLVNHFIRGYFDGRGSIYLNHGKKCIELKGTIAFLKSINKILKQTISSNADVHVVHNECGYIKYCGNKLVLQVGQYLYKNAITFSKLKRDKIFA